MEVLALEADLVVLLEQEMKGGIRHPRVIMAVVATQILIIAEVEAAAQEQLEALALGVLPVMEGMVHHLQYLALA
jgi:butyrate kinase